MEAAGAQTAPGADAAARAADPVGSPVDRGPAEWRITPFDRFLEAEGIPVVTGLAVPDLKAVEVAPWARLGVRGSYVRLLGSEDTNSSYVMELPPGGATAPERHLYEEFYFAVDGRGACEVWNDAGARQSFEWQAGSLFSIPVNCHHRLHNGSGTAPARLLGVTTAPLVMNLFHNLDFVFGCPFDFTDRFDGREGFFGGDGTAHPGRIWETNFVADVYGFRLQDWAERGAGGKNILFEMANSVMCAHISEFPVGTYKKAHRHGPGAHVVILAGEGYSLMWPEGSDFQEVPWRPGSMFVPPGMWWHQHFNTGPAPARYLAIRWGGRKWRLTQYLNYQGVDRDKNQPGGNQIEYEDQDPRVHRLFVERCAARGVPVRMEAFPVRA